MKQEVEQDFLSEQEFDELRQATEGFFQAICYEKERDDS